MTKSVNIFAIFDRLSQMRACILYINVYWATKNATTVLENENDQEVILVRPFAASPKLYQPNAETKINYDVTMHVLN